MLQANELRIGNYLQGEPFSIPRAGLYSNGVTKILAFGIQMISEGKLENLNPILLTPEILEGCWFRQNKEKEWYHPSTMNFELRNVTAMEDGFKIVAGWHINKTRFRGISNQLQYVHQLQNLYFALTGQELEVKFPESIQSIGRL